VELSRVSFRYGRRRPWVLRDVSVGLPSGRIIEVTGSNGAGKSTLLRVVAGLLRPQRGSVIGRPASVGYAPERFPTEQPFPVSAYLRMMAEMRGLPRPYAQRAIAGWSERLGFGHLLGTRLPDLSKGSAHKVGLTQALLGDPALLILDEPFAGLDPQTREALPEIMAERAYGGATIIVTDHQGALRDVPDIDRLRVDGHTVAPLDGDDRREHVVIEILVPADEADRAVRRLQAEGRTVIAVRSAAGPHSLSASEGTVAGGGSE
jgi:ABC-type multidrug transport system ATPase subunit